MSTFEGHNTLQNNLVEETSLKASKLNGNTTIKWCPKDAVHTQPLDRLNVSPECLERTLVEVPQKIVETPPVEHKKTVVDKQKSVSQPTSMIHTFKSNTPSSQRTRSIKNMMDVVQLKADANATC